MAFSLIREIPVSVTIFVAFFLLVSLSGKTYGVDYDSEAGGGGTGFGGGGSGVGATSGNGGIGGGTGGLGGGGGGGNGGFGGTAGGLGGGGGNGAFGAGAGGLGGGGANGGFGGGSGGLGGSSGGFGGAGGIGGVGSNRGFGGGLGGGGGSGGFGGLGGDSPELLSKALECLNEKHIYKECEEAWRLTLTGYLNIPVKSTEEFCEGPCFSETHLVLNCIDEIVHPFRFLNRATVYDIRETLETGCSYGPERGDFNVLEHLEDEENGSEKVKSSSGPLIGSVLVTIALLL